MKIRKIDKLRAYILALDSRCLVAHSAHFDVEGFGLREVDAFIEGELFDVSGDHLDDVAIKIERDIVFGRLVALELGLNLRQKHYKETEMKERC